MKNQFLFKVSPFYHFDSIKEEHGFFRKKIFSKKEEQGDTKKEEFSKKQGVYFWGFYLGEEKEFKNYIVDEKEINSSEIVIYYIGKTENGDKLSIPERLMQEFSQLILGGFGCIIDIRDVNIKAHEALLKEKQDHFLKNNTRKNKNNSTIQVDDQLVLYYPLGIHDLSNKFFDDNIQEVIKWMKKRLIFAWIEQIPDGTKGDIIKLEKEMHHIVTTNCLGIGGIENRFNTLIQINNNYKKSKPSIDLFNKINWGEFKALKEWLEEVNKLNMEAYNQEM